MPGDLRSQTVVDEIPPSSSRVTIRTMQSDMASIGATGGLPSAPESVNVLHKENIPPPPKAGHMLAWAIAAAAVLAALFLIGFLVLPKFFQ